MDKDKIYIAYDPATKDGDYGCEICYKLLPDGKIEVTDIKYTRAMIAAHEGLDKG